jgi:hypothetical protein
MLKEVLEPTKGAVINKFVVHATNSSIATDNGIVNSSFIQLPQSQESQSLPEEDTQASEYV